MGGSRLRLDRTADELTRLRSIVDTWTTSFCNIDTRRQYATQIGQLSRFVGGMVDQLDHELAAALRHTSPGDVYAACQAIDRKAAFTRRYWSWFTDKLDQRRPASPWAPVVKAADEVVWSLYATAFPRAEDRVGAVPMPFVDAEYSPYATPRDSPPPGLRVTDKRDALLAAELAVLPIPVIGIPPVCLAEPWLLVLLAHEVGHHVQFDAELEKVFAATLERIVSKTPDGHLAPEWTRWSPEVFADTFGVLAVGPGLVWAQSELERGGDDELEQSFGRYPPALVRWRLMVAVAAAAGLRAPDDIAAIAALQPNEAPPDAEHDGVLAALPEALFKPIDGDADLRRLSGFSAADHQLPHGAVIRWSKEFERHAPVYLAEDRPAARLCVAGGLRAWRRLAATDPDDLQEPREAMAAHLLEQLAMCQEPGDRADAAASSFDPQGAALGMLRRLDDADPEALG